MSEEIPFNRPTLLGHELDYIRQAVDLGHASGDGTFTRRCQALIEAETGGTCLLTTSCTHALELAALLLELKEGDEVILPSFTFVSTANAFVLRGARPVFADIRDDTLNLDERRLEALVTPRTRAIAVVHYAGVGCEMDAIGELALRHGLTVVEDNAHGFLGTYRGRALGSFGALSALSFHETKNFTCGEGGALIIHDKSLRERAEILREKGTNRKKFFRGEVDKYTWVDVGSSYLPSDLLAAFLCAQLEERQQVLTARRQLWERYESELREWAAQQGFRCPHIPEHCGQAYHMFYLLAANGEARDRLIAHLRLAGIHAVFHYQPLHQSVMGRKVGRAPAEGCPVAESIAGRLVRLPFFTGMSGNEQDRVIEQVLAFRS